MFRIRVGLYYGRVQYYYYYIYLYKIIIYTTKGFFMGR